LFSQQAHLGSALIGADPAFRFLPSMRVEGACASGGLAFASAFESIQAGTDITLVAGVEVQTTVSSREGGDYLARAADYKRQRALDDFTFPAIFAQRVIAYSKLHNVDPKDIARIALKAYSNAAKNPLAHMKAARLDFETATTTSDKNPEFISNPELKSALRLSDCSQVSDGGAALILVSEEGLKAIGKRPSDVVEVLTVQVATDNLYNDGKPDELETTKAAAQRAYATAGVKPEQIQVAEVHDCFTIAEILMYEALGFAPKGQGVSLVKSGATNIDGKIPVNTGGGLIGFGHPVGATGVKQILEVVKQLKGQAGAYQVKNNPQLGLCANMGGSDKTAVVTILKKTAPSAAL